MMMRKLYVDQYLLCMYKCVHDFDIMCMYMKAQIMLGK